MKISADKTYVKYVYNDKNANLIRKFKPSKHKFADSIYKFDLQSIILTRKFLKFEYKK